MVEGRTVTSDGFQKLVDSNSNFSYIISNYPCVSRSYIDYLYIFYSICGDYPVVGYFLLCSCLLILFYLLANTASEYFCSSLEGLSRVLNLSPAIAGVTLLALGNGAPDVFGSIVAFMDTGTRPVALSSVLGGAFFVSSIVVGTICLCVGNRSIRIDRSNFIRDVCFYLLVLAALLLMLLYGRITFWWSMCFMSLYFVYVFVVSATFMCRDKNNDLLVPLLADVESEESLPTVKQISESKGEGDREQRLRIFKINPCIVHSMKWVLFVISIPLYLPRKLTIPDASEERWSKPRAVISVMLAPLLLATLWNSQRGKMGSDESLIIYMVAGLLGIALGAVAMETTESSNPPRKCLLIWLAGGFFMSMIWTYVIARELVSLLVSIGIILKISPSILGVTILAWGNSVSDLIANLALAMNREQVGAQIAISGSYAGPMFNTLVGLGLSLVLTTWYEYPNSVVIPKDSALFETLGFLCAGLLWALVVLPRRRMKLGKVLGIGLLAIYFSFLCLRIAESLGSLLLER